METTQAIAGPGPRVGRVAWGWCVELNAEGEDTGSERAEVHFLAALVDELMRKMLSSGVFSRADLNEVERAAAERVGGEPRGW